MTYATVSDLEERLDWELSPEEQGMAAAALEDLSEWAQHYGRAWTPESVPRLVVRIILAAAARFMRNPEGLDTSRAGDETVVFQRSAGAGTASFNDGEIRAIGKIANPGGTSGFHSLQMVAYGNSPATEGIGYVPAGEGFEFPLFAHASEPW